MVRGKTAAGNRAGCDEVNGVTPFAVTNDFIVRDSKSGPKQAAYAVELLLIQAGKDIEPLDQLMNIETNIETRALLSNTSVQEASPNSGQMLLSSDCDGGVRPRPAPSKTNSTRQGPLAKRVAGSGKH